MPRKRSFRGESRTRPRIRTVCRGSDPSCFQRGSAWKHIGVTRGIARECTQCLFRGLELWRTIHLE